jgi:hypothetical protein
MKQCATHGDGVGGFTMKEVSEGDFGFPNERCLAGGAKFVKTGGWTHEGAVRAVFDEGLKEKRPIFKRGRSNLESLAACHCHVRSRTKVERLR